MTVRVLGIVFVLAGTPGVAARGAVQITHSISELSVTAAGSSFVHPCSDQVRVETLGNTELNCVSETSTGRAETILSLSMLSSSNNRHISMRLLNDSQVSGGDGIPTHTLVAGGAGWVNLGFTVTDEPMQVTVTIRDIGTDAGASSFTEMRAFWSGGAGGSVISHAGQTTQEGTLTGVLEPGSVGYVFLEFEDASAYYLNPNTFAHADLTLDFEPVVCSAPKASAAAAEDIFWHNPAGGSYSVASNWDPARVPVGDCADGDTAIFDLDNGTTIAIDAPDAAAGRWRFLDGAYRITGTAELFASSATDPSLRVAGSDVTLSDTDLLSVDAAIGPGSLHSQMEVTGPGSTWENSGPIKVGNGELVASLGGDILADELLIGSVSGAEGTVRSSGESGGDESLVQVAGTVTVGGSGPGVLEVLEGAAARADEITIGEVGEGSVLVKGSSNLADPLNPDDFALLLADTILSVGGAGGGTLTVEDGGVAQAKFVLIDAQSGGTGNAVVNGQEGLAILNVLDTLTVGATEQVELEARDGGLIQAQLLVIGGNQARPGTADVTVRGSTSQPEPERRSKLRVFDHTSALGPAGPTLVGANAPGQLNILEGGQASLEGGLRVGGAAQGIVIVSAPAIPFSTLRSSLSVTGQTNVGHILAPGVVSVGPKSDLVATGNLSIGLGTGNPNGTLNVSDGCNVTVSGTLAVGMTAPGLLAANLGVGGLGHSFIRCDTLLVGGDAAQAPGRVDANLVTQLEVSGNAQIGVGAGFGEVFLDTASFLIGGTLTIGNFAGGPGGGSVVLSEADIFGTGNIVVNSNGSLTGTGEITVPKVNAGGQISVQSRPQIPLSAATSSVIVRQGNTSSFTAGALTIIGDYELFSTGLQIISYAGEDGGEFDRLIVTGTATLGGRLEVHFRNGYSPADPEAFIHAQDFVESGQGVVGDYAERVFVYPDEFADFDEDGDKDLRDVAAFANCFAESGELSVECARADWENDGVIGERELSELARRVDGPQ